MTAVVLGAGVAAAVAACVAMAVLRLTLRFQLVDRPNERSAHVRPMPTAGGLGILAGCWVGLLCARQAGAVSLAAAGMAGLGAGTCLLLPMVWDDLKRPLRVPEKLVIIVAAAAGWLLMERLPPGIELLPALHLASPWWTAPAVVLWFVGMCNACNFMDGIDGIVTLHLLSASAGTALVWAAAGGPWVLPVVLAGSAGGFLVLNYPPARLFMGDIGSSFIGFALAALGVAGGRYGVPLWLALLLNGAVIYDTGYTLLRRGLHGENLVRAHQKHIYQRLVRVGWTHRQVDLGLVAVDALLGGGCVLLQLGHSWWGGAAAAGAGLLLAGATALVERRDRCFG